MPGEKVVQQYGKPEEHSVLVRLPQPPGVEEGFSLEKDAKALNDAVKAANLGPFKEISREVVGPAIGKDLQRKGLWATLFSILGITAYIALRFRLTFAIGAIAATFHDILVTLAFLVFFGYDLSLNVIAALLTITGYSVNDTIVIFDRVRENMHTMRRDDLEKVVNQSVNQTLGRTLITAGTTFLSVLALYLFGGEVLEGFAFTMLVGIVSGTYSTIFIAAAVAILMSKRAAGTPAGAAAIARAGGRHGRRGGGKKTATRRRARSTPASPRTPRLSPSKRGDEPATCRSSSPRSWGPSRASPSSCRSRARRTCCSDAPCSAGARSRSASSSTSPPTSAPSSPPSSISATTCWPWRWRCRGCSRTRRKRG